MWRERWTVAGLHRGPGSAEQPLIDNQTTARVEKSQLWDFAGGPGAKTMSLRQGVQGLIPGRGTRSCMPQLKIWHATVKIKVPTCCDQDLVQPNK